MSIAYASGKEAECWLDFAHHHGYLTDDEHRHFINQLDHIGKMLHALIGNWR